MIYKYNKGDYVDPKKKFIFLDYLPGKYLVQEECSGYIFSATRWSLHNGQIACAPQRRSEYRSNLNRKYHVGDILGPDNNIKMIDDSIDYGCIITKNGKKVRKYLWENIDIHIQFVATVSSVLSGHIQGVKGKSKGESKASKILSELSINFIEQYSFKDCINPKTNKKLRFDFYLPDHNCCIEYDGRQHYGLAGSYADLEGIENIAYRDELKGQYCIEHQIGLLRIPYHQYTQLTSDKLIAFLGNISEVATYNNLTAEVIKRFTEAGY